MTTQLVQSEFNGVAYSFSEDGWFNATEAAARFGKRPNDWLALDETRDYIAALSEDLNTSLDGNSQSVLAVAA